MAPMPSMMVYGGNVAATIAKMPARTGGGSEGHAASNCLKFAFNTIWCITTVVATGGGQ